MHVLDSYLYYVSTVIMGLLLPFPPLVSEEWQEKKCRKLFGVFCKNEVGEDVHGMESIGRGLKRYLFQGCHFTNNYFL